MSKNVLQKCLPIQETLLYNTPCTKAKGRGKLQLEKSVEVYGNIAITEDINGGVTEKFPINLEYYKIHNNVPKNEEKPYGIGIIKTHEDEIETIMEKSEFNHIFTQEKEADSMLKLLLKNKVTPVSLREILEDFVAI